MTAIATLFTTLLLAVGCPGSSLADGTVGTSDIAIFRAAIDDSARGRFFHGKLEKRGRAFVVYRLDMADLGEGILCALGCETGTTYAIERDTTGLQRWIGLKLSSFVAYAGIADDLTFAPLEDRINKEGGTSATEFLQMAAAEQIS